MLRSLARCGSRGFTIAEVVVSSAIGAVVAGGTLTAFVTAARIIQQQESPVLQEALAYGRQTLDGFRNRIACDYGEWFDPVTCAAKVGAGLNAGGIHPDPPAGGTDPSSAEYWTADPLLNAGGGPYQVGRDSIFDVDDNQFIGPTEGKRCYRMWQDDCDGDGTRGDCYAVQVKVCWVALAGCTC